MEQDLQAEIASWTPDAHTRPDADDWFPLVFEQAPFGIAAIDMVGNFVRVNAACAHLHGRTVEEMCGSYALGMGDPVDAQEYEQTLELGRQGEMPLYQAEHAIVRPDGSQAYAIVTASTVNDADGNPVYFLVQYDDTTDVRQLVDEARATTQAYGLTLENSPIAIFSVDLDGTTVDWNPAADSLFGWAAAEVLGQPLPLEFDSPAAILDHLLSGDSATAQERAVPHRHGHLLSVVSSASVIRNEWGHPERILVFNVDLTAQRQREAAYREFETRMRTILSKISDTVTLIDRSGAVIFSSAQYSDVLGYSEEYWTESNVFTLLHPDDAGTAADLFAQLLASPGTELTSSFRLLDASGGYQPIEAVGINLLDDSEVGGIVLTTRNLTELQRAKDLLADESAVFERIARNDPLTETLEDIMRMIERNTHQGVGGIVLLDEWGHMEIAAAPNVPAELLAEVSGKEPYGLFATVLQEKRTHVVDDAAVDPHIDETSEMIQTYALQSGWVCPILDSESSEALGFICTYYTKPAASSEHELEVARSASHLVSIAVERARSHDRLHHQANHDPLTSLPNRPQILDRLQTLLAEGTGRTAVLFLDLDRFKVINDSLGHAAGDRLLQAFARRLRSELGDDFLLGRFSADEFVILAANIGSDEEIHGIAGRIRALLNDPFLLDEGDVHLSVSIGAARELPDSDLPSDAHGLVQQASAAMVEAKQRGRDRLEMFDDRLRDRARKRLSLERDLRHALDNGELRVYYQPKVDLRTGQIVGTEALVRWEHSQRGLILPTVFVPLAEETGLIARLGRYVLETAVGQARAWKDEYQLNHFVMSVNFSPRQMSAPDLVTNIARVLLRFEWPPEMLSVEVTESILIDDTENAISILEQLKSLGVMLAIDDFGTGYSSLSYLHRFPVDIVKIDRAFIIDLEADGTGSPVAAAVMLMANAFGVITAAEGIETPDQLSGLRKLGCQWAQGFLMSKPLPADDIGPLLAGGPLLDPA